MCVSDVREVHPAAELVVITSSLQGYLLPFSSSSSELDGEDLLYNFEADTLRSVKNPSVSSDEESMRSGNQHCITSMNSEYYFLYFSPYVVH